MSIIHTNCANPFGCAEALVPLCDQRARGAEELMGVRSIVTYLMYESDHEEKLLDWPPDR